jgi:molybdopterin-guanine dinucleotide biosynthesis protein A
MPDRFFSISGFILAGGASRRMGQPKERLLLDGETMLDRQIRLLRGVCRTVGVLGPPERIPDPGLPVIPDALPDRGPLGGIFTGLLQSATEFNLFLSCDLPFMKQRFLHYLCSQALAGEADVTVAQTIARGLQPLAAVYRRRALWAIRRSLERGENKISRFFRRVQCRVLSPAELARAGFSARIFANMNTREDYETVKRILNCE